MTKLMIVFVGSLLLSTSSFAGAILFEKKYVGVNPLSGLTYELRMNERYVGEQPSEGVSLTSKGSFHWESLKLHFVSRNIVETIYEIRDEQLGGLVARVVTTGDCQEVKNLMLIQPSGVSIPMKSAE